MSARGTTWENKLVRPGDPDALAELRARTEKEPTEADQTVVVPAPLAKTVEVSDYTDVNPGQPKTYPVTPFGAQE